MIKISEIFYSIQGESTWAGNPTVFVRTTGCHLRCSYCDTKYSYAGGTPYAMSELLDAIDAFGAKYVCVTGGEPLLQSDAPELMSQLVSRGYHVSLETSGNLPIDRVPSAVKVILDVKTPDSGEADSFISANLANIDPKTEFKFVICSDRDFEWSEAFCRQHDLFEKHIVLFSPSFGVIGEKWLAEKILQKKLSARLQLQQHKYIWSPEQRGV